MASELAQSPPITNRHLTETAEIVHARAVDFIFKPHGDAADIESIILTREQYRQLLPGGERHAALDAVKLLLASRPVVYIGFGLRDPDFLYIRDLLSNTYKGGSRDHYAIMSDIETNEIPYWRANYGIHLINYDTTIDNKNNRNHQKLLDLLDDLSDSKAKESTSTSDGIKASTILALARHASRLSNIRKADVEFPVRVSKIEDQRDRTDLARNSRQWLANEFLLAAPQKSILTGLPGAGKTYALSHAAAQLASNLNQQCLSEKFDESKIVIPILVDLKIYQGNLFDLAEKTLPEQLPLEFLMKNFKVKFFFDSFNEMPRVYWENTSYENDFASFIKNIGSNFITIGSRTTDGLKSLDLPAFDLAQIDRIHIEKELNKIRLDITGDFKEEIISLLQKPFYFQLIKSGTISLPKSPRPKDIFHIYFSNLDDAFQEKFKVQFSLLEALIRIAYQAINRGEEAQTLKYVNDVLAEELEFGGCTLDSMELINWLVSRSIFIPYTGFRIAFFHQSATEYLAAKKLVNVFLENNSELKEKLRLRRWDQALFITLSLLPKEQSDNFIQIVSDIDLELALKASKYVEEGRDELVAHLLKTILLRENEKSLELTRVDWIIEQDVPISNFHENILRDLIKIKDSIGAAALIRLAKLKGKEIKEELFAFLNTSLGDFNFLHNGVAYSLRPMLNNKDLIRIRRLVLEKQIEIEECEDSNDYVGFTSAISALLNAYDSSDVERVFFRGKNPTIPDYVGEILCESLWNESGTKAWKLAANLLKNRISAAATSIFFLDLNSKRGLSPDFSVFNEEHVNILIDINRIGTDSTWEIRALRLICENREDLRDIIEQNATLSLDKITNSTLEYCATGKLGSIFEVIADIPQLILSSLEFARIKRIFEQVDIDWHDNLDLLMLLLSQRNSNIAKILLKNSYELPKIIPREIEINNLSWWLEWLEEEILIDKNQGRSSWDLSDPLSAFLAHVLTEKAFNDLLIKFNSPRCTAKKAISRVINYRAEISTDSFSEDAINFMIAELYNQNQSHDQASLVLGKTATESFTLNKLLPLLGNGDTIFIENLKENISIAGERHGRRYLL